MVFTRSQCRAQERARLLAKFPDELWIEILSHLPGKNIGQAALVCRKFARLRDESWQYACAKRWPDWYHIARAPDTLWRRQYELFELREREQTAVAPITIIVQRQSIVNARHRTVLAEWLAEVAWDWSLDTTIVFKAVNYLDHYLASNNIDEIQKFQLIGIACLRAAMIDNRAKIPTEEEIIVEKELDPQRFAYISDRTYSPSEVKELTEVIQRGTPDHVRMAPNAKMFLRSFWYRAVTEGLLHSEEMHLYTIASFLLQLGLLDLDCSKYSASCVAAAALSNALEIFGKTVWSPALQHYSAYTLQDLQPCKLRQRQAQALLAAEHLRQMWRAYHENHGYEQYSQEWSKALLLIACPSRG